MEGGEAGGRRKSKEERDRGREGGSEVEGGGGRGGRMGCSY